MSSADDSIHLYQRAVSGGDSQDSLSLIAALIEPGQTLLDLGMGTGGLGQYLSQRGSLVADGLSLNPAEAEIARSWYRRALVADLDNADLISLFDGQRYDCIVCADVLEHLKSPQNILAQCKALLKPGGRLIASVPNAGYCGLIAELILGDFRYRSEGLLDHTHLRFFTRCSLQRFYQENGWHLQSIQTTQRDLLRSEFRAAFDQLPPAVARHLLALPDALNYQFITVLQPEQAAAQPTFSTNQVVGPRAKALFSAQVYLGTQGSYSEAAKLVAAGEIGNPDQILLFQIPASETPYTGLRLDPADRPGFFRLHHLHIQSPKGTLMWYWQATPDALAELTAAPMQQIVLSAPGPQAQGALLLLQADDPWLELPLSEQLLQQIARTGATLQIGAGWPMSADYLQAIDAASMIQTTGQQDLLRLQDELAQRAESLQMQIEALQQSARQTQVEKQQLQDQLQVAILELAKTRGQLDSLLQQLQNIEQSTVFRATRPLVHLKMRLDRALGRSSQVAPILHPEPLQALITATPSRPQHPVDIIVPVYRGLLDTQRTLESVLHAVCQTPWRLVIINDHSPEPELTEWLRAFALRDTRILYLENELNLGFVGSVNRGMALSQIADVLLLNSDTEVANDWLDRLQRAAYSTACIGSVTPFSNNATIFSYPRFCQPNELPTGQDTASLDRLFAQHLAGQHLPVPTGVGFCMYIRRQCLQEVGLFDVERFGKGYGEENDFCVRASGKGWTHLHALDTFVRHVGGSSFGDSKSERERLAMQTLQQLHPNYEHEVHAYIQRDPAQLARLTVDHARAVAAGCPIILIVTHGREGGTLRHIQELTRHLAQEARFLLLKPAVGGLELRTTGQPDENFSHHFVLPQDHALLLQTLQQLQVGHIHYHHLLDHASNICALPTQLGVSHDFTAHDFFSYCPQISLTDAIGRYCGEQGIAQCHACLLLNPAPDGEAIESWRARHAALLNQARYVICPSMDAGRRMQRFVPAARVRVVPHASLDEPAAPHPTPQPRRLAQTACLKVVVLGALSKIKGADTFEELSTLAAIHAAELEFHLLGYPYRELRALPRGHLTIHGGYQEGDLPQLLQNLQADVVWFPALWPETYSYTLSCSLEAGLPVVAPDLGAFAERLQNRDWTWLCPWYQSAQQWLEFFLRIRQDHFCSNTSPPRVAATSAAPTEEIGASVNFYRGAYLEHLSSANHSVVAHDPS